MTADGGDNYQYAHELTWQVHVYGAAKDALRLACAARRLPLHTFPWQPAYETSGLARGACYLLRPDTYVALADPEGDPATLERYFLAQRIET